MSAPESLSESSPHGMPSWPDWEMEVAAVSERLPDGFARRFLQAYRDAVRAGNGGTRAIPPGARAQRRLAWVRVPAAVLLDGLAAGGVLDGEPVTEAGPETALARLVARSGSGVELVVPEGARSGSGGWWVQGRAEALESWGAVVCQAGGEFLERGRFTTSPLLEVGDATSEARVVLHVAPPGSTASASPAPGDTSPGAGSMEEAIRAAVAGRGASPSFAEVESIERADGGEGTSSAHRWARIAWPAAEPCSTATTWEAILGMVCAGVRPVAGVGATGIPGAVVDLGSAVPDGLAPGLWGVREQEASTPSRFEVEGDAVVLLGHPLGAQATAQGAATTPEELCSVVRALMRTGMLRSARAGGRGGLAGALVRAAQGRGVRLDLSEPDFAGVAASAGFWSADGASWVLVSCAPENAGAVVARAGLLGVPAWRLGRVEGRVISWASETGEHAIPLEAGPEAGAPPASAGTA